MGAPFAVSGTLTPFDIRLTGERLNLQAPQFFLGSSETDADLGLRFDDSGVFVVSGDVFAHAASLELGLRQPAEETGETSESNRTLERILLNNIRLQAPQRIRFQESVISGEFGADIVVTGSAADIELSGSADVIRV